MAESYLYYITGYPIVSFSVLLMCEPTAARFFFFEQKFFLVRKKKSLELEGI